MADATSAESLAYVGVVENEEVLAFHADLFANQLAKLLELDEYFRSFPWRCVACLSAPLRESTLEAMRLEWRFVTSFVDKLPAKTDLHTQLAVTRHQPYRDLMTKAELPVCKEKTYPQKQGFMAFYCTHLYLLGSCMNPSLRSFNFDHELMSQDASLAFRRTLSSFAGLTSDSGFTPLLTSLPNELAFNDLRDSGRRHSKQEKADPCNMHAVCLKSCLRRPAGCETLDLADSDWTEPVRGRTVKARVHQALRPRDIELGIDCEGLTRHRVNTAYTKPHVFCQRLRLLQLLQAKWESTAGDLQDRRDAVLAAYKDMWISKLIPSQAFIHWKNMPQDNTRQLILSSGPHAVHLLPLRAVDNSEPVSYTISDQVLPRDQVLVGDFDSFEVCLTSPVMAGNKTLAWAQKTSFMSIQQYVADYMIPGVAADALSKLCTALKLKGHTKLNYKKRLQAFLEHMGKDPAVIQELLDEIPDQAPRQRKKQADPEDCSFLSVFVRISESKLKSKDPETSASATPQHDNATPRKPRRPQHQTLPIKPSR